MINKDNPQIPTITKIDNENVLFSIPTFETPYEDFVEVVKKNMDLMASSENLIIDIRGNRGGNAVYFSFLELYATEDKLKAGNRGEVYASSATQEYYERMSKYSEEIYGSLAKQVQAKIGKIIPGPKYKDQPLEPQVTKIKNVAILTDGACGSAAESFIMHSKRISNKVKTFGSPTYGMIDNTSVNNIKLSSSGNQNIYFVYPTSTLGKIDDPKYPNGYNENGMLPDVPIDEAVTDKVKFIMEYYQ